MFVPITKRKITDSITVEPNRTHYSYFSLLNATLLGGRYREGREVGEINCSSKHIFQTFF